MFGAINIVSVFYGLSKLVNTFQLTIVTNPELTHISIEPGN